MVKTIKFLLPLLLVCSLAYADSITSISGTYTDGSYLTLSGTFTAKSTAAPVKFDNFDDGTATNSVSTGGWWSTQGTAPVYSVDNLRNGSGKNAKSVGDSGTTDGMYKNGAFSDDDRIYVNFWLYFNRGSGDADYQIKLWRLQDTNTTADYPGISDFNWGSASSPRWSYYQITYDGGGAKTYNHGHYPEDTWLNVEVEVEAESSAGALDGEFRVWHNGVQQINATSVKMTNGSQDIGAIRMGSALANGGISATQYFDDVYIDDVWQRVMVCEGSSWSTKGVCEMQPADTWTTGQIEFFFNQGSFSSDDTVYAYVVDANGNASSPLSFIVGEEAGVPPNQNPDEGDTIKRVTWSRV